MQIVYIVLAVIIGIIFILYFVVRRKLASIEDVSDSEKIITLTDQNFANQIKNKLILIDFWAPWCAPCRMMAPILNDVANELDNAFVGKLDVEKNQAIASKYQVRSIPTLILFKNGKEIDRFVGVKNKDFLLKKIDNSR